MLIGSISGTIGFFHQAPAGGKTVTVEMKEFRFIPSRITVERGRITFEVRDRRELPHVLQIIGAEIETHIALLPGRATTGDGVLT